jgi:hypothetical protein
MVKIYTPADIWTGRRYFGKSCRPGVRRGNITWTRALQPDLEEVRSWRFCRAQIVRVWAPIFWWTHIFLIGAEISTSALFLSYIMWRSNFTIPHSLGAYILDMCIYFGHAHIFWTCAYILNLRIYFEKTHTFWESAYILSKGLHIWTDAKILCVSGYFRQVPIFWWFLQ